MEFNDVGQLLAGDDSQGLDVDALTAAFEADINLHRVIIDCTNKDDAAGYYERWMSLGVNIISPGKKAAAGTIGRYHAMQQAQRANSIEWQYESSVGSALPILTTPRDLIQTGTS